MLGQIRCRRRIRCIDVADAIAHHKRALTLAGQPDDRGRAHDGLAHPHHTLHQHQARTYWRHVLNLLTDVGVDRTDDEETTAVAGLALPALYRR